MIFRQTFFWGRILLLYFLIGSYLFAEDTGGSLVENSSPTETVELDQRQKRERDSLGLTGFGVGASAGYLVTLQGTYNLTGDISLGFNLRAKGMYASAIIGDDMTYRFFGKSSLHHNYVDELNWIRYFPIRQVPVYIFAGAGYQNKGSLIATNEFQAYYQVGPDGLSPSGITYTYDSSGSFIGALGAGISWIFDNGLTLDLEIGRMHNSGYKHRIQVYRDYRSYLFPDQAETADEFLTSWLIVNNQFRQDRRYVGYQNLGIGMSFSL